MAGAMPRFSRLLMHDGAQRRPMQMVEMRVRYENQIDRRQVGDAKSRSAKPLQHKQPPRKIGIDDHTLAADLNEEAGVADEGDAEFAVGDARRGLWVWPQRGVTAEWRTKRPNCVARLRRAGLRSVCLIILRQSPKSEPRSLLLIVCLLAANAE